MKYKVGDRVRIKSIDWYNENKTSEGCLVCGSSHINPEMICMLGKTVTISSIEGNHYRIKEYAWNWTDEMIEGLAEEETMEERENLVVVNIEHKQLKVHSLRFDKTQLMINDEYELKQEGDAYYIVRKKTYPKTYEECAKKLGYNQVMPKDHILGYKGTLLSVFQQLLICRDAYWEIAGEEMGLDKPWKPDWNAPNKTYYTIIAKGNEIYKSQAHKFNEIFAFPSEEMRDAFKENFDADLEFCKELL